jgi:hypothetical protein
MPNRLFKTAALTLGLVGLSSLAAGAGAQQAYLFPAAGTNLGAGQFWVVNEFSEGRDILDVKIQRFDTSTDKWTGRRNDITADEYSANPTNDKHLTFGHPLQAPIDGEVISCWRNNPDNPKPGEKLPGVQGSGSTAPKTIFQSGNHLHIQAADGRVFQIAHLKQGTMPAHLCPHSATYGADTSVRRAATCHLTGASNPTYARDSYVPAGSRPRVRRGEFIGQAGNSGNSTGPHIHIASRPGQGEQVCPASDMPFFNAWRQDLPASSPANPNAWEKLNNKAVINTDGNTLILPGIAPGYSEVARHGVPESHYQQTFMIISGSGYKPDWVDGYRFSNNTYYNAVFRPADGIPWVARHGLNGTQYQTEFNTWKNQGYRLVHVDSYAVGSDIRYAPIFRKDGGPLVAAYHGLTAAQHQVQFDNLTQSGWTPKVVSVASPNGTRYYTGVYEKKPWSNLFVKSTMTPAEYQQLYNANKDAGRKLVYLNAYEHSGQPFLTAVWSGGVVGTIFARHGISSAQYQSDWETATGAGYKTQAVSGYTDGGSLRYAAFWKK